MKLKTELYDEKLWVHCKVVMNFVGKLCGSVPGAPDLITPWLENRKPSVKAPGGKSLDELNEEVVNRLKDQDLENAEIEQRSTLAFESAGGGLVIRAATIRAHFKDCARQLMATQGRIQGEKGFAQRVINGLYVLGNFRGESGTDLIRIMRDGKQVTAPDGYDEKTVHVMTPKGMINALKRVPYIVRPTLEFTVSLLAISVNPKELLTLCQYGGTHGYGGERSMQDGQYIAEIDVNDEHMRMVDARKAELKAKMETKKAPKGEKANDREVAVANSR